MNTIIKSFLLPAAFALATLSAGALSPSYYASRSKLESGKWVKIKITETGMHQITYDQLREWGFSDPSKVAVFGYGGAALSQNVISTSLPDDVAQTASMHTADGRILFYGEADTHLKVDSPSKIQCQRNYYSLAGYYLLSDAEPVASIPTTAYVARSTDPYDTHMYVQYHEDEVINPASGGALFFGPELTRGVNQYHEYDTRGFATKGVKITSSEMMENGRFYYNFKNKTSSNEGTTLTITYPESFEIVSRNDVPASKLVTTLRLYNYGYGTGDFVITDPETSVSESIGMKVTTNTTFSAIDYTYLLYPRYNSMSYANQVMMYFPFATISSNFSIADATPTTRVWNIADINNIRAYSCSFDESTSTLKASFTYNHSQNIGAAAILAFDTAKQMLPVEFVEQVANQNIHADATPDMVIITTASLYEKAKELAQIHYDLRRLKVNVYTQEQVFNEFSSGTPSAVAFRRVAKMFYDRQPAKMKYVLLYGSGSWDNRHIILENNDYLLTYQTEAYDFAREMQRCFTADSYFGMVADKINMNELYFEDMQLSVGRIPAVGASQAAQANNKIREFISNPPSLEARNRAIVFSDKGDANVHFSQSWDVEKTLAAANPAMDITSAHNLVYPRETRNAAQARAVIIEALCKGQGYFNYTGHGDATSFSGDYIWNKKFTQDTEYTSYPLAMLSTCSAFEFDRGAGGISETMFFKENGGMIGVVGACRSVYLDYNQTLNLAMARNYAAAPAGSTIGDIYRNARNEAIEIARNSGFIGWERGVNTLCYNLCGDPSVPISGATHSVGITEVDGVGVVADEEYPIHPLVPVTLSGYVFTSEGDIDDTFNGTIKLDIFDGPYEVSTLPDNTDPVMTYILDQEALAKTTAEVVNGHFTATLIVPQAHTPNVSNRMILNAVSNDNAYSASGSFQQLVVGEYDPSLIDDQVLASTPEIISMYINDESFSNGDRVDSSFTLYAVIDVPESGINTSTGILGQSARMLLDGKTSYSNVRTLINTTADGRATIEMPMFNIADGRHTIELTVRNNAGNGATRSIDFSVLHLPVDAQLTVAEEPARTSATFDLAHNITDSTPQSRLVIVDACGNTVFTQANVAFPYEWDLRDSQGQPVPDGRYKAFSLIKGDTAYGSTDHCEVIVVR